MRGVAITGLGVVCAAGMKGSDLLAAVESRRLDAPAESDLAAHLEPGQVLAFDRASQLAVVAAKLAYEDAGRPAHPEPRLGVSLGNTSGCLGAQIELDRTIVTEGPQNVRGSLFPYAAFNTAAANIAGVLHAKGPNFTLGTGKTAGTDACAEAVRRIRAGDASAMFAGGVEAPSPDLTPAERGNLGSDAPPAAGAAVVLLESLEAATGRGARIHARITASADLVADDDSAAALARAARSAAASALDEAGLTPSDIGLVVGDADWAKAVLEAPSTETLSIEPALGDTRSASGAFQVAVALLASRKRVTPRALCITHSQEGLVSSLVIDATDSIPA